MSSRRLPAEDSIAQGQEEAEAWLAPPQPGEVARDERKKTTVGQLPWRVRNGSQKTAERNGSRLNKRFI